MAAVVLAVDGGRSGGARWRPVLLVAVVAAVVALAAVVVVPRLDDGGDGASTVIAGGADAVPALPAPAPPTVSVQVPPGWQVLRADGFRMVVATRPLAGRDLVLALLARDDAAFTAFPADGTVFVVGGDPLKAKYTGAPSLTAGPPVGGPVTSTQTVGESGPGPALAFGPLTPLKGGVTVRTGDVPQSIVWLAVYAGPRAPAAHMAEAEAMAASVELARTPRDVVPPPPPPGSRPGFDQGGFGITYEGLADSATVRTPGGTVAIRAQGDCAVVVSGALSQPIAGGCQARPAEPGAAVVAATMLPGPPPGAVARRNQTMVVLARVGPGVTRVTGVGTDGRTVALDVGTDGWVLGASDGRVYLIEARDRAGTIVAATPVR